jgi:hypothetical protein
MVDTSTSIPPELTQTQLSQLQADFNIQQGETDMLIMDMPNVPPQAAPVLMQTAAVMQKIPSKPDTESLYGSMGACVVSPSLEKMGIGSGTSLTNGLSLYPQGTALRRLPEAVNDVALQKAAKYASVQIFQQPKHGIIVSKDGDFYFVPDKGYVGNDKVVFLVNIDGRNVKTVYYIKVIDVESNPGNFDYLYNKYCPQGTNDWQISANATDTTTLASILGTTLATTLDANTTGITVNIADLPNAAIGQTTGTAITLDTNAAGYGWYIDPNPAANTDFLPTSNPNVWIAAPGSAAAGKMDMLSVLLHEYGHALGLDHSANPNDFMAPNLQPGERRLPSAAELTLMSQLALQLNSGTAVASSTAPAPTSPTAPVLPIGTALSALLIGRLRRTDYGSLSPVITSVQIPAPQFELAINSTLTNSNFASGTTNWTATGNVTTNPTGTATLTNSTSADAQLAQAFNITSQDRYIEFTVVNGLQKGNGPADAFQVGLDNAVTGTALVGTDGLSNSDGLLNIQADGTTHTASSVQTIVNADGTTTYVIDLQNALSSGAITGTPAALSFDLIGFGNSQSQITIKDIKLLQTMQGLNETVSTSEDASVNISPLAANAAGATPQLNITQNPANGVLTQNADGTFSYVPNTHFFGTDSFQYSYTTNGATSNVATVNIAVSEVAYPPTASNSIAVATAGKPYTFDPLAGAADINGNVMTRRSLSRAQSLLRRMYASTFDTLTLFILITGVINLTPPLFGYLYNLHKITN